MKALIIDSDAEGMGIDLAYRAQEQGHVLKYWLPTEAGKPLPYGQGILDRPDEWEPWMDWADLVVIIGNSRYVSKLAPYFGEGYPIFGTNAKSAELELDRGRGQEILAENGVETLPYQVVDSVEDAIALIEHTRKPYAMKPWGGDADKAMSYVARTPADAIFTLRRWERCGLFKGQLMMQEKADGIEMGISAFFGPHGWGKWKEESFEHKKFLHSDLGENTGEMGTVIRHVLRSKLFDSVLDPVTDYLHRVNYVGDCSVNCIIDKKGNPWPLEFTMRLGWPDFCIRQRIIIGDRLDWMLDCVLGRDTMESSTDVAVGILLCHGDFPRSKDAPALWSGFPVYGVNDDNLEAIHWQQVMDGEAEIDVGDEVQTLPMTLTGGTYVTIVSGMGRSVSAAQSDAYRTAWELKIPSNTMFRTDIGDRLEKELPELQDLGFATGMRF